MKIGITGLARHGKSTAAKVLVEEFGFTAVNFADSLRRVLLVTDPWIVTDAGAVRLTAIITEIGWERAKDEYPEVRRLMKILATEGIRANVAEDAWIQGWEKTLLEGRRSGGITGNWYQDVVAGDLRFVNEAEHILQSGGQIWRVVRPGHLDPASDGHRGELGLPDGLVSITFINDGSIEDLRQLIRHAAAAL